MYNMITVLAVGRAKYVYLYNMLYCVSRSQITVYYVTSQYCTLTSASDNGIISSSCVHLVDVPAFA